jgi:tryptophan synthase alpha chain
MSRIAKTFEREKAFIGYLTVGDQSEEYTAQAAIALIKGGVNLIELGLPFSDPVADGPVIQASSTRALSNKTTPLSILKMIKTIRAKSDVPIVVMTYYNPILQAGKDYLSQLKKAGMDGLIVVDLPFEEAEGYLKMMRELHLDTIFLVSPNTQEARLMQIIHHSTGFIYYACQKGTTGMRKSLPKDTLEKVKEIKDKTQKPVVVGFGIQSKKDAKQILTVADGFVVGSAIVQLISKKPALKDVEAFAKKLNP